MSPPTYRVTDQQYRRAYRPDGTEGGEFTVHLEHDNGVKSRIVVPEEHYTPANVHQRAQAQSDMIHAVGNLPTTASPPPARQ